MHKRFRLRAACGVAAVAGWAALSAGVTPALARDSLNVSVVLPATGTEYGLELRSGVEAAAAEFDGKLNLRFVGPAQIDPGEQVKIFNAEIATRPDVILLGPVPPSLFIEGAKTAESAGIPVVWYLDPPPPDITGALFVGPREYDIGETAGKLVAEHLIEKSGGADIGGVIPVGNCVPGLDNLEDRILGFIAGVHSKLPDVEIPKAFDSGNDRAKNFANWQQSVQANPNGPAFMAICEPGMINLAKIKEDSGLDFELTVFDAPEQVRVAIANGTISSAVPPPHFVSTYLATWITASRMLADEELPEGWLPTVAHVFDASNVDALNNAMASPASWAEYYMDDIEALKARIESGDQLPAISGSRP